MTGIDCPNTLLAKLADIGADDLSTRPRKKICAIKIKKLDVGLRFGCLP